MKFIILTVFFILRVYCEEDEDATLKLVHVFFRHGSRTPDKHEVYPNDPYAINNFKPTGFGQLTNIGKKRAYHLGDVLRNRYDNFLGEIYTPGIVYTTTTDTDRTKMSAQLVLAGLFPPSPTDQWDQSINWMPIPYHYEKNEKDYTLRRPNTYCPAYMRQLENVLNSDAVQKALKEHTKTFQHISRYTGKNVETLQDMFSIYQVLNAEENMNLTLPKWTTSIYPEEVYYLAAKQCFFENHNRIMKRLNGGRMLKKVVENMILKTEEALEPPGRKIYLHSGHDNNIIGMLAALNLYELHFPKYSSAVAIELYYLSRIDQYAVKVIYIRDVYSEPEEKFIHGCGKLCEFSQFLRLVEPHLPVNYTKECESAFLLD